MPRCNHLDVPDRALELFWRKVDVRGDDECWPFQRSHNNLGYGMVGYSHGKGTATAHRVAWVSVFGQLPPRAQVRHICQSRDCCNPKHLRIFGAGTGICRNGHVSQGAHCRTCANAAERRKHRNRAARKEEQAMASPLVAELMQEWETRAKDRVYSNRDFVRRSYLTLVLDVLHKAEDAGCVFEPNRRRAAAWLQFQAVSDRLMRDWDCQHPEPSALGGSGRASSLRATQVARYRKVFEVLHARNWCPMVRPRSAAERDDL